MVKIIEAEGLEEGMFFCKWLDNRFNHNKNVLGVELGGTGSGKSYRDLRKLEIWYKYKFNEDVPTRNICFEVKDVMKLISSGRLRRGEIIMLEEAGVNLGSLDFHNKISKMMVYVLQSFRSMNIGIFFNLPYLSMLNKSTRMLLHYSSESGGIDFSTKKNTCKLFYHQVNQGTGKIYKKYPRILYKGRYQVLNKVSYSMPADYLIESYEKKKQDYLDGITSSFSEELQLIHEKNIGQRNKPTDNQLIAKYLTLEHGIETAAKMLGVSTNAIYKRLLSLNKKKYLDDEIRDMYLEKFGKKQELVINV